MPHTSFPHFTHRVLVSPNGKAAFSCSEPQKLVKWELEGRPKVQKIIDLDFQPDIRPMDTEHFLVLNDNGSEVQIRRWKGGGIEASVSVPFDSFQTMAYFPETSEILVGGGWEDLRFLHLETAETRNPFPDGISFEVTRDVIPHPGYEEIVLMHEDQFSQIEFRRKDEETGRFRKVVRLGGDVKNHRDSVAFSPAASHMAVMWMSEAGEQIVKYWHLPAAGAPELLWTWKASLIVHPYVAPRDWMSGLAVMGNCVFVAAGKWLVRLGLGPAGELGADSRWELPVIANDLAVLPNADLLIATESGLLRWDTTNEELV